MVSKRIKYARAHLSRRRHIAILATPSWRRTLRTDFNCLARPFSVSRGALRARATKRIKTMAKPKHQGRKYERSQSRMSLQYPRIHRDSLIQEPSKRIFDLSLPKKSALVHSRRFCAALGHTGMLSNISGLLRGIRKSRYQKYRIICNSLQQRAAAREEKIRRKLRRALKKPSDWEKHNKALERLAAPKRVPKPPRPPRGAPGKGKRLFNPLRTDQLAVPMRRGVPLNRDPFQVQPSALHYRITERMRKLVVRENPRPEPRYRIPGRVVPQALEAVASPRLLELAEPAKRPPGRETDLKEDAFSVSPMALKARCSPLLKALAQPKYRVKKFA